MKYKKILKAKFMVLMTGVALGFTPMSYALSLEERVERLERMANNPVVLKLTQQLNQQKRELQSVQNRLDLLLHQMQKTSSKGPSSSELPESIDSRLQILESEQLDQQKRLQTIEQLIQQVSGGGNLSEFNPLNADLDQVKASIEQTKPTIKTGQEHKTAMNSVANPPADNSETSSTLAVPTKPITTRLATESEEASYQAAFELMRKSKYHESVKAFTRFALENQQSALAPNAWYWAGEGQYILGDNDSAKQAFDTVIEVYSESSKASDARLRLADTLVKLGDEKEAKKHYQHVIENFSASRAAENAQKRLKDLK